MQTRREQLRAELTDAWNGSGSECTFRAWVNDAAQDDTHTLQNACKEFIIIVDEVSRDTTEKVTGIKKGYVAHNGYVFTQSDADAYNRAYWEVCEALSLGGSKPSPLAQKEINRRIDQKCRLFKAITGMA